MRSARNSRRALADAESGVPQATSRTPTSTHRFGSPMARLARDGGLPKRRAQAACTRGVDLRRARVRLHFVAMPSAWFFRRVLKKRTPLSHAAGPSGVQPPGARLASGHQQGAPRGERGESFLDASIFSMRLRRAASVTLTQVAELTLSSPARKRSRTPIPSPLVNSMPRASRTSRILSRVLR